MALINLIVTKTLNAKCEVSHEEDRTLCTIFTSGTACAWVFITMWLELFYPPNPLISTKSLIHSPYLYFVHPQTSFQVIIWLHMQTHYFFVIRQIDGIALNSYYCVISSVMSLWSWQMIRLLEVKESQYCTGQVKITFLLIDQCPILFPRTIRKRKEPLLTENTFSQNVSYQMHPTFKIAS